MNIEKMLNDKVYLKKAIQLSRESREIGNHPFASLLVSPDGEVLLKAQNSVSTEKDRIGHAEINLVRQAARKYSREELLASTLYSSAEPCAMCSGAIYWGNIGRVVYALSETGLLSLTGNSIENPTLSLPCRDVFSSGQRSVEVVGPMLEDKASQVHQGFWR